MLIFLSSIPLRSGLALKYQKAKKLPTIMSHHWTGQCIDGHISEMVGSLNVSVNDAMIQPSSELTVHHFYVLKKVRISLVNLDNILFIYGVSCETMNPLFKHVRLDMQLTVMWFVVATFYLPIRWISTLLGNVISVVKLQNGIKMD